jgi:CubicO group peptidase (beta-lactamase class C family)
LLLASFLALSPGANAANGADRVGDFVNDYLKRKQIPGCAVMVRRDGKVVLSAGYGMANLEHAVRVTPQTIFQSGSMGKQFTSMAVMMLVEEGKLSLDDPITKHLSVPSKWSGITVRHLLTHTSGLGDYPAHYSLQDDYTEAELLKMISAEPLAFAPGEKWNYSNLGYVTLGILMHRVTGAFYGEFLQKRIFDPLGMKNTRIIDEADVIPNRAAGYILKEGVLKNQKWVAPSLNTTADGSLYFTAEDIAIWDEALEAKKLLSPAGYERMWTPVKLNDGSTAPYGFGWGIHKTNSGRRMLEHGGAWQGFATYLARYPEDRLTVAILCNRAGADGAYIAKKVAGFYIPELAPRARAAVKPAPESLHSYAGDYRLEDRFTVKVTVAGDRLETNWRGQKVSMVPESEGRFFEEDSDRTFRFMKDDKGKISALVISVPEELILRRLR